MIDQQMKLLLACELKEQIISKFADAFTSEKVQPVCDKIHEFIGVEYHGKIETGVLVLALDMIIIGAIANTLTIERLTKDCMPDSSKMN